MQSLTEAALQIEAGGYQGRRCGGEGGHHVHGCDEGNLGARSRKAAFERNPTALFTAGIDLRGAENPVGAKLFTPVG